MKEICIFVTWLLQDMDVGNESRMYKTKEKNKLQYNQYETGQNYICINY